jgi:glucokinase
MAQAFVEMGRFAPLMAEFAISVVEDDYAALLGCAAHLSALPQG